MKSKKEKPLYFSADSEYFWTFFNILLKTKMVNNLYLLAELGHFWVFCQVPRRKPKMDFYDPYDKKSCSRGLNWPFLCVFANGPNCQKMPKCGQKSKGKPLYFSA